MINFKTNVCMKTISKKLMFAMLCIASLWIVACDDMNSIIQDDLDKGEAIYIGKVNDYIWQSGKDRVRLFWIVTDRRVSKTIITWNDGKEDRRIEKVLSTAPGNRIDSVTVAEYVPEGVYNFVLYNTDDEGNFISIKETVENVSTYGDIYASNLSVRNVSTMEWTADNKLKITWAKVEIADDADDVILSTVMKYKTSTGATETLRIANDVNETVIDDIVKDPFEVTSWYIPRSVYWYHYYGLDSVVTPVRSYVPPDIVRANPQTIAFPSKAAAEAIVAITSDVLNYTGYDAEVEANATWVTVEKVDANTLKVKVAADTVRSGRTATVTVKVTGAQDAKITVSQPAYAPYADEVELPKTQMSAHYVGDDNRTLFDPNGQTMNKMFDGISQPHTVNQHNIFCTAPNTDGTIDIPPLEGSATWEFPFYFTMDLGADVYLNTFKITPRTNRFNRKWEFGLGSPYNFEIYGTNEDKSNLPANDPYWQSEWLNDWHYLGNFTCSVPGKPDVKPENMATAWGEITGEECTAAGNGYVFRLLPTSEPVKYLRFKINKVWNYDAGNPAGITTYVHIQEVWFWGQITN
jgi:hypothetical protein